MRRRGQHGATSGLLSCVQRRLSRADGMCGGQAREKRSGGRCEQADESMRAFQGGARLERAAAMRAAVAAGAERERRGGACACAWR